MSTTYPSAYYSRSAAVHLDESVAEKKRALKLGVSHYGALGLWAVIAFGPSAVKSIELPEAAPLDDGELVRIELVAPKEPQRLPGSILGVGEVVDGFSRESLATRAAVPVYDAYIPADWNEADLPVADVSPPRRWSAGVTVVESSIQPVEPRAVRLNGEDRAFGFGERLPDFAAERRARREAMEPAVVRAGPQVLVIPAGPEAAGEDDQD